MNKLNYFFAAALAVVAVACNPSEDGPKDFPIKGEFSLYAEGVSADKAGVFVTSEGVMQANLEYAVAEGEGSVALTAAGEKAGFKQGDHVIYAYAPYAEAAAELASIPMPDYSVQATEAYDPYADDEMLAGLMITYASVAAPFQVASTELSEYSSAAITLPFESPVALTTVSVMEYGLNGDNTDAAVGKKVSKIVVSADTPIAIKNATYNFEENKVTSEASNSIELSASYEIFKMFAVSGSGFSFKSTASLDALKAAKVKIEVTLEDGSVYAAEDLTPSPAWDDEKALMIAGLSLTEVK